jgi:hypothetical protein
MKPINYATKGRIGGGLIGFITRGLIALKSKVVPITVSINSLIRLEKMLGCRVVASPVFRSVAMAAFLNVSEMVANPVFNSKIKTEIVLTSAIELI